MSDQNSVLMFQMQANIAQLEKTMARAEARVTRSANDVQRRMDGMNKTISDGVAKSARAVESAGTSMSRFGQITGQQRFIIQNTAAQFGDMAVQFGMGTNALTIMGQQLPQILGPMGIFGALAGTAAAVMAPLIKMIIDASGGGRTFEESLKAVNDALQASEKASDLARGGIGRLFEEFGQSGKIVRDLVREMESISLRNLTDQAGGLADQLMFRDSTLRGSGREQIGARFGFGTRASTDMSRALSDVDRAGGIDARVEAMERLRQMFVLYAGDVGKMTADELAYYSEITDALEAMIKVQSRLKDAAQATNAALVRSYQQYGASRTAGAEGHQAGSEMLADMQQQLQVAQAIATHGSQSAEVARLRAAAEREALVESLKSVDAADSLKAQVMAAYDAMKALAGVDAATNINLAASAATALANEMARAVQNAVTLAAGAQNSLEAARINYEFRDDPTGRARALAQLQTRGMVPEAAPEVGSAAAVSVAVLREQRDAFIEARVAEVGYVEALREWNEEQSKANRAAKGGAAAALKEQRELVRDAEQVFRSTRTEAELLAIELAELNTLRNTLGSNGKPLIDEETYRRAKADLEGLGDTAKSAASAVRNAFVGLFDDPAAALKQLAMQLAQMALFSKLATSFPGLFGSSGVVPLVGHANGGYTGDGGVHQPAGVVHRGEVVWSQRDVLRAGGVGVVEAMRLGVAGYARGGAVSTTVPQIRNRIDGTSFSIIDQRAAGAPDIETTRKRGPNGREIVTMIIKDQMARGAFNAPMRGQYGVGPQKVKY